MTNNKNDFPITDRGVLEVIKEVFEDRMRNQAIDAVALFNSDKVSVRCDENDYVIGIDRETMNGCVKELADTFEVLELVNECLKNAP